jgi:hypothetical protein
MGSLLQEWLTKAYGKIRRVEKFPSKLTAFVSFPGLLQAGPRNPAPFEALGAFSEPPASLLSSAMRHFAD